ncbi:MAG: nucleotide pyrophosphohydrolase [bacterium]|nr:nucleotide pyrophosphohydrolase [bacterium]
MALSVEASELMEHFQWLGEAESRELSEEKLAAVQDEMADVLIYLVRLADVLEVDLLAAAGSKLDRNRERYPADLVRGSAKKASEY